MSKSLLFSMFLMFFSIASKICWSCNSFVRLSAVVHSTELVGVEFPLLSTDGVSLDFVSVIFYK